MKSKKYRRCLSFICAAALVSALIYSPAGRFVTPYSAGVSVQAEGEVVPEGTKNEAMAILMTLLLGNGFRMVGSFADQASGLGDLFDKWVSETQATITTGAIVLGTRFQNGWMKLSNDVVNAYNDFSSWLAQTFSIPTTGTVDIPIGSGAVNSFAGTGLANSLTLAERTFSNGQKSYITIAGQAGVYVRFYYTSGGDFQCIGISATNGATFSYNGNNKNVGNTNVKVNGVTYYYGVSGGTNTSFSAYTWYPLQCVYLVDSINAVAIATEMATELEGGLADTSISGESLDLKDGINLDEDQALLLDLSYLAEYAGVLDQTLTTAQDLIGTLTNAIDRSKAEADEDEDAEVLPWDLVDSETDSKVAPDDITDTPPNETGMYKTLGLEKVFPFSIPFDIYYFIKMFNATAQAPEFDIPFVVTGVINERYHVDLSMFDPVAAIFRTMMLVGFIWFLITKTRDFLRS